MDLILQLLAFLAFMILSGFGLFIAMAITIMIIAFIDYVFNLVRRKRFRVGGYKIEDIESFEESIVKGRGIDDGV